MMGEVSVGRSSDEPAVSSLRSLGHLFGEVSRELGELVKHEVELAKSELRDEVRGGQRADIRLGWALAAGAFGALFASLALVWGLAEIMPTGLAFLLVAAAYGGAAAYLVWQDRREASSEAPEAASADGDAEAPARSRAIELSRRSRDGN